jgi:hypothetical protein
MTIPYASATSDMRAREEIRKILSRFGCATISCRFDNMPRHYWKSSRNSDTGVTPVTKR